MQETNQDAVSTFNKIYTDQSLTKLKIICSHFTDYPMNLLALYIKLLECTYTFRTITSHKTCTTSCSSSEQGMFRDICKEILPFCNAKEQNMLNNLLSFYENMENMQEMMQMMELMQEMNMGGNGENSGSSSMDLNDILNMMNAFSG